ncbi:MAG: SWIM zinc finger family protein [Phreatobacter sp.]
MARLAAACELRQPPLGLPLQPDRIAIAAARIRTKKTARFDIDALRQRVGAKVFARGQAYCRDGRVEIVDACPERVLAQVMGTEDYRIEIVGRGGQFDGMCSCPANADGEICKHRIAVALAIDDHDAGAKAGAMSPLARIRVHLREKGVDALVEMSVEQAEFDPALFRRLDMAATLERAALLAPAKHATLHERGRGRLRSALDLPTVADDGALPG